MSNAAVKMPLKALIVEDCEDDLLLLRQALKAGGFDLNYRHVQSKAELVEALKLESWQVVISDFNLPTFDALSALEIVRPTGTPFFVVSGTIGEEMAVTIMKAGAQDYVMKGNLARLIPAIQRELKESEQRRVMQKELELREEQLRQSQKMEAIGSLAGGIAHDFNNFLASILMLSEVAASKLKEADPALEDVTQIQDIVQRAAAMTRQLLTFSRPQVGQLSVISINDTIQQMLKMLKTLVGEQIKFDVQVDQGLFPILMNPSQLEQIVLNLIVNSRDAMPSGGQLSFKTFNVQVVRPIVSTHSEVTPGKYAVLSVQDSGAGMDSVTMQRIFEPFFSTKGNKGTGLGLSTVFGIVQHAKGQIVVKSEIGNGSLFEVYFPACDEASENNISQPEVMVRANEGETILLVEDQDDLRKAMSNNLRRHKYIVFEASGAEEAMAAFEKHGGKIDLMISDLNLPGMSGIQLIKKMRDSNPNFEIILMSGYVDEEAPDFSDIANKISLLQKPFPFATLLAKIRLVIQEKRKK